MQMAEKSLSPQTIAFPRGFSRVKITHEGVQSYLPSERKGHMSHFHAPMREIDQSGRLPEEIPGG
jgi:hypothetical protein